MKTKRTRSGRRKQSSSEYFQSLRPKFLDWRPPTEAEKLLEVQARKEARDLELKRVTELAKERDAIKGTSRATNR